MSPLRLHHTMPSQTSTVLQRAGLTILPSLSSSPVVLCKSVDSPDILATASPLRFHHNMPSQASTVLYRVRSMLPHPFPRRMNYCARKKNVIVANALVSSPIYKLAALPPLFKSPASIYRSQSMFFNHGGEFSKILGSQKRREMMASICSYWIQRLDYSGV
ncbi:hypothetical protein YC2023_045850 [Brassica napus]